MSDKDLVTYVNKETGKVEKMNLETGETFKPEQFYIRDNKKKYNLEDAANICALVRDGYPLASIGDRNGLPSIEVIYYWKRHHPDFALALVEAREYAAEKFAFKAVETADLAIGQSKDELAASKLQVDTYKWMAEKMNPELYGNRTKVTGDADKPLTIIVDTGIKR